MFSTGQAYASVLLLIVCANLVGCGGERARLRAEVAELQAELDETQEKLELVSTEIEEVRSAYDDLELTVYELDGAISQFGFMDWQFAVMATRNAGGDLAVAMYSLESELSDAESAIQ